MGLISIPTISDGTVIDANDVNNPLNTIVNEINGNINYTNISTGGIATANIADNAVTTTKIPNAAITTPKITNPYKFFAYRSGNLAGSNTKIPLNAVLYDTNNNVDIVTNFRYSIPVSGYYQLSFDVATTTSAGTGYYGRIMYNGNHIMRGSCHIAAYTNTGAWNVSHGGGIYYLSAGGYLELYSVHNAADTIVGASTETYMSGFLVSET